MGTDGTENSETISALRTQMASEAADRFLRDLSALGMDRNDAVRLLNERKDTDHA